MEGRASTTFSSSTTRSRWIGSGRTGCCGPKGMMVRAIGLIPGRSRSGRGFGGGRVGLAKGKFHGRVVQIAVKVHRHSLHVDVEEVVHFIFVEEGAGVDGT